jgi:hypothetical protein
LKSLAIVAVVLGLLVVPAGVALAGTGRAYLTTTRDVATLRFAVVGFQPASPVAGGYRRVNPGPDVTLRLFGVEQTELVLAEVNFDLEWQGARFARASQLVNVPIPRGAETTVTVETNLEPEHADEARALFARGDASLALIGQARLQLPHGGDGVWLNLRGTVRATTAGVRTRCQL